MSWATTRDGSGSNARIRRGPPPGSRRRRLPPAGDCMNSRRVATRWRLHTCGLPGPARTGLEMISITIAMHEFRRLLRSPLPWFLFALVHFLEAMVLFQMLSAYLEQQAVWQGFGITETVVAGTLRMAGMMLVLVTPFLTMRLCSDEQRHGTLSLLHAAPIRVSQVVIGKFLGILLLLACSLAPTPLLVISLRVGTAPDPGQIGAGILGL